MQTTLLNPADLFRLVHFFDILAAVVFAVSGALVALRKGMDVMGAIWLAVITGVGGGTVRDLILGVPVFWVQNPVHVTACLVTAVVMHFVAPLVESRHRTLLWFDAFGLALVTVAGTVKALDVGVPALGASQPSMTRSRSAWAGYSAQSSVPQSQQQLPATEARPAIAAMLEAQSRYVESLLAAYAGPSTPDLATLDEIRAAARLARSNSEAVVERMLTEPRSSYTMRPRTAVGLVGAARRNALAALSLHAGLERDVADPLPAIRELASQVGSSLMSLATALREQSGPPALPPLRQTQLALATASDDAVSDDTSLIVDSIDTMAELLAADMESLDLLVSLPGTSGARNTW